MLQATAVESIRAFLAGFETLGSRLGATALLVAVFAVVGWVVLPDSRPWPGSRHYSGPSAGRCCARSSSGSSSWADCRCWFSGATARTSTRPSRNWTPRRRPPVGWSRAS
ncbi:hypothetical protein ACFQL4_06755 [Halosimplex aquaticum]